MFHHVEIQLSDWLLAGIRHVNVDHCSQPD